MQNKNAKLYLFLEPVEIDGKLNFTVLPEGRQYYKDNLIVYETDIDPTKRNQIRIDLLDKQGSQSHLLVKEIRINDCVVKQWELCTIYVVKETNTVEQTYGYLGKPGTMFINLHQSALISNYVSYFLSRCKGQQDE
jgi:hypothetical protein